MSEPSDNSYSRRDFLRLGALLAAGAGLSGSAAKVFADGLEKLSKGLPRVLWLQGQSCSGCSVSLLNSENPDPAELLTQLVSLVFHQTLSAAQGDLVLPLVESVPAQGDFLLIVEGSIPAGMPEACLIAGKPLTEILPPLLEKAKAVVAVGTCAAYGGIPAAEGNATGALSVKAFMEKKNIPVRKRLVNCPSCPAHPESIVGTLAYVSSKGYPPVHPELLTPNMFYAMSTHDECPRFHSYEKKEFAQRFGDQTGCLFKLGCLGPLSYTNCPARQWNGGVNWCIRAAAPCIGCTSAEFALKRDFPFYRKGEAHHTVGYSEVERTGGQ